MQQSKVQALADCPRLTTVTEVQSFLSLANYYHRFIRDFARISAPLLQLADSSKPYVVTCDTSDIGIGAVLEQEGEHGSHPVAFASRKHSSAQK
jgi:RNase H-like domain found in reverse transcriptase